MHFEKEKRETCLNTHVNREIFVHFSPFFCLSSGDKEKERGKFYVKQIQMMLSVSLLIEEEEQKKKKKKKKKEEN